VQRDHIVETRRLDHVPEQPLVSRCDFEQVDPCGCASVVRGRGLGVAVAAVATGERFEVAGVDLLGIGQQVALPPAIVALNTVRRLRPQRQKFRHLIAFVGTNVDERDWRFAMQHASHPLRP